MTSRYGTYRALSLVDFSLGPHLDHPDMPDNSMAEYEKWAAGVPVPTYAIDDQTAIKVVDGSVEVVSEGRWKLFAPLRQGDSRSASDGARCRHGMDGRASE